MIDDENLFAQCADERLKKVGPKTLLLEAVNQLIDAACDEVMVRVGHRHYYIPLLIKEGDQVRSLTDPDEKRKYGFICFCTALDELTEGDE